MTLWHFYQPGSPGTPAAPAGSTPGSGGPTPAAGQPNQEQFSQFMTQVGFFLPNSAFDNHCTQMMGQMRAGNPEQAPEERFASQLDQLASMGFVDRQANIQGGEIF